MDDTSNGGGVANHVDPMESLLREIARALVDDPDAVAVEAVEHDESTILRLQVSEADIGKVIGKQGRTAHSLRTILSAVSTKYHHRYSLDIVETGIGETGIAAPSGPVVAPPASPTLTPREPQG